MSKESTVAESRRQFLKFLAASPLIATGGYFMGEELFGKGDHAGTFNGRFRGSIAEEQAAAEEYLISSPQEAINVFDFEAKAHSVLPPGHWSYLATGTDDDGTLHANMDGFKKLVWHPRRLVDVSNIDTSLEVFGQKLASPIFTCATSANTRFHTDGELAVARACKKGNHAQMVSTATAFSMKEIIGERGAPSWWQLYWRGPGGGSMSVLKKLVGQVESAGCNMVALTVDTLAGRNTETESRLDRIIPGHNGGPPAKSPACAGCHGSPNFNNRREKGELAAAIKDEPPGFSGAKLTWDHVRQIRDIVKVKFMLKGIVTPEDAELSLKHGLDGVYVSNHGGRSASNDVGTIDVLPAIAKVVNGKVPIVFDSGVRRGTDVFKALSLGATVVGVGRPYVWGLASFGQAGVEKVLDILQKETELAMGQAGAPSLKQVAAGHFVTRKV